MSESDKLSGYVQVRQTVGICSSQTHCLCVCMGVCVYACVFVFMYVCLCLCMCVWARVFEIGIDGEIGNIHSTSIYLER